MRAIVRLAFWAAAVAVAVLAVIALGWAIATVWPAYVIGAFLLTGLVVHDRRRSATR